MSKYIKLEDALKYVQSKIRAYDPADDFSQAYNLEDEILLGINSLPSIDPQEMIENIINTLIKEDGFSPNGCMVSYFRELLNKLPK